MYKIDLHTHSNASPDGGIKLEAYRAVLESGKLNAVAITDHEQIDNALKIQKELGDMVIVGEEIKTKEGEIVGLFLNKRIREAQSALKTAEAIKAQGGIVYVPHPFEVTRQSLSVQSLEQIKDLVDIVEVYNGRSVFPKNSKKALAWARANNKVIAASSDAHGKVGLGATYSLIESKPSATNLVSQLGQARFSSRLPYLRGLLAPKLNQFKKKLSRTKHV